MMVCTEILCKSVVHHCGDKMLDRHDLRLNRNFMNANLQRVNDITLSSTSYKLLAQNGVNTQIKYFYFTSKFVYSQTAPAHLLSNRELVFF